MSIVTIEDTNLTNIANAIRNKKGTSTKYKPNQMASAIESIEVGMIPTGGLVITENGTYDVIKFANVEVMVENTNSEGSGSTYAPSHIKFSDYMYPNDNMDAEVKNLDTSNIESFSYTFYNTIGVSKLDLSSWNTSNCRDFSHMFEGSSFEYIDASNFTFEEATTLVYMFENCSSLETLVLGAGWLDIYQWQLEEDMGGMPGMSGMEVPLLDNTNIQNIYVPDDLVGDFQGSYAFNMYADYIKPKSEMPN